MRARSQERTLRNLQLCVINSRNALSPRGYKRDRSWCAQSPNITTAVPPW